MRPDRLNLSVVTDAHSRDEIDDRAALLERNLDDRSIDPVASPGLER